MLNNSGLKLSIFESAEKKTKHTRTSSKLSNKMDKEVEDEEEEVS